MYTSPDVGDCGSPPPIRGKENVSVNNWEAARITPAYAGKRHESSLHVPINWDHPRLCGEKLKTLESYMGNDRITPAYAGKSTDCFQICGFREDHPRLCGEKWFCCHTTLCFLGSPPPMRGKVSHYMRESDMYRITPAYAGKRCRRSDLWKWDWDHPRLCGEK